MDIIGLQMSQKEEGKFIISCCENVVHDIPKL